MEIEQVCVIPAWLSDLPTVYRPLVKRCVEGMLQKPADPIAPCTLPVILKPKNKVINYVYLSLPFFFFFEMGLAVASTPKRTVLPAYHRLTQLIANIQGKGSCKRDRSEQRSGVPGLRHALKQGTCGERHGRQQQHGPALSTGRNHRDGKDNVSLYYTAFRARCRDGS